jgi:hypothetical protein
MLELTMPAYIVRRRTVDCKGNGRKFLPICSYYLFFQRKIEENRSSNTIMGKIRTLSISKAKLISTSNFYAWVEPKVIIFYFIDSKTA